QGVGYRYVGVRLMQLVEVHVVGAKAPQAAVYRGADVVRCGTARHAALLVGHTELGGQHHLVAPALERLTHEALALGGTVSVGRVHEGDAGVYGRVEHVLRTSQVEPAAEVVAAEADDGDVQGT